MAHLAPIIFILALSPLYLEQEGWAGLRCAVTALRHWFRPTLDAAVELEMSMSPEVLALLTTTDGKVGPVLGSLEPPPWLLRIQKSGGYETAAEVPFDSLRDADKLDLLRLSARNRGKSFLESREVEGLVTRERIRLRFKKPTVFLGTEYPPGEHLIDLSRALQRRVEYRSANDVAEVSGVELHMRDQRPAAELSNDAWTFQDAAGIPRSHQHVHVVAPLPVEKLRTRPAIQAIMMADYYRRFNLAAEMINVVHYGRRIARVIHNDGTQYFGPLNFQQLYNVANYFQSVGRGVEVKIDTIAKIAWVGMRGSHSYDTPGLWGAEARAIRADADPKLTRQLLSSLQASMNQEAFGISPEQAARWYEHSHSPPLVGGEIAKTHYNQPWQSLLYKLPQHLRERFPWLQKEGSRGPLWKQWEKRYQSNEEVKMLVFDWSNDPLFYRDARFQESIRRCQIHAIRRLERGDSPLKVMQEFMVQSGLYHRVLESVGLRANLR